MISNTGINQCKNSVFVKKCSVCQGDEFLLLVTYFYVFVLAPPQLLSGSLSLFEYQLYMRTYSCFLSN